MTDGPEHADTPRPENPQDPEDAVGSESPALRGTRGERFRAGVTRTGRAARDLDRSPALQEAVRRLRGVLPGDAHFGDPLSLGGARHTELAGRTLVGLTGGRPGVVREVGLGGLQLWQSVLERFGGGTGERELALVFTDLVDFSRWALRVGDDEVLRVLRLVGAAWEEPVTARAGTVVKRLGDGMMAVFADPSAALAAVVDARTRIGALQVEGWRPRMRAGVHLGRPRRVGGDYLGVSVNTAARIGDAARADEVLVSGEVLDRLDPATVDARRRRWGMDLKGAPEGLRVYAVEPR